MILVPIPPNVIPRSDRFLVAEFRPELLAEFDAAGERERQLITELSVMHAVGGCSQDLLDALPAGDATLVIGLCGRSSRVLASAPGHVLLQRTIDLVAAGENCSAALDAVLSSALPDLYDGGWMCDQTTFVIGRAVHME